jgi:hypothetical protein
MSSSLMVLFWPRSAIRIFISRLIFLNLTDVNGESTWLEQFDDAGLGVECVNRLKYFRVLAATDLALTYVIGSFAEVLLIGTSKSSWTHFHSHSRPGPASWTLRQILWDA